VTGSCCASAKSTDRPPPPPTHHHCRCDQQCYLVADPVRAGSLAKARFAAGGQAHAKRPLNAHGYGRAGTLPELASKRAQREIDPNAPVVRRIGFSLRGGAAGATAHTCTA
jgi:hypothetical protein